MSKPQCVIVGAGHAAAELCASLRRLEWSGDITLIGDEPHLPYHRPPLSKTMLDPGAEAATPLIRSANFYASKGITTLTSTSVEGINRKAKTVQIGSRHLSYDVLVQCTGSVHCLPPIAGTNNPGVYTLRTAVDAAAIRECARPGATAVIIGAGFIGLEVAASLRKQDIKVTVLELAPRVLARTTPPELSTFFELLHRQHGVHLQTGVAVCEICKTADGLMVMTRDSQSFPADIVVLGTGAVANTALASQAGLAVDNGILVDSSNRSSDPAIYALGDCCTQMHPIYQQRLRLESVQNAVDQAKNAASAITGRPVPPAPVPWFWSDQYDIKYQIAGVSSGYDELIIRGRVALGQSFSAWHFHQGRLLAVDAINDPTAFAVAGKLIAAGRSPAPAMICNSTISLRTILTTTLESPDARPR